MLANPAKCDSKNQYDKAVDRYSVSQIVEEDERRAAEERCRIALEKGLKEGRKEGQRIIASQMKRDGISIESIAKYTELSIEEIEDL